MTHSCSTCRNSWTSPARFLESAGASARGLTKTGGMSMSALQGTLPLDGGLDQDSAVRLSVPII